MFTLILLGGSLFLVVSLHTFAYQIPMNLFMFTILRPVSQYTIISGVRQKQKQKHFAYTLANTWNLDVSKYPDVWFHTDLTTECLLFFFLSAVGAQHSQWIPQCRPQWIYHSRANPFFSSSSFGMQPYLSQGGLWRLNIRNIFL